MASLPPLSGPWATVARGLRSPWLFAAAGVALAGAALVGLTAGPGMHPALGPVAQVAVALLAFGGLARAIAARRLAPGLWAVGLGAVAVGAAWAGSGWGSIEAGARDIVESYDRAHADRPLPTHLGAQLQVSRVEGGTDLRLGIKDRALGAGRLTHEGSLRLGPWSLRHDRYAAPGAPTHARLRFEPREGEGTPLEVELAEGETARPAEGISYTLRQLSPDFGRALGPAVRLTGQWPGGEDTSWHFTQAADLDRRAGLGPFVVVPLAVEASPSQRLLVRRAGPTAPVLVGLGLMIVALLLGAARRKEDG